MICRNGMEKAILYINHDFPPMSGPGVWRALWFVKYLSEQGYKVTVICGNRSAWCNRYDNSLLREIPKEVRVKRLRSLFPDRFVSRLGRLVKRMRIPLLSRGYDALGSKLIGYYPEENLIWFMQALVAASCLVISGKIDCVISSGPPHFTHVIGGCIRKIRRLPWIMDYRDLWTDDIPAQCPEGGYQRRLYETLERKAIGCADAIVTVSPSWVEHLKGKFSHLKDSGRFFLIRNGHNIGSPDPAETGPPRESGRLHIHFNGTPQMLSKTDALLRALVKFKAVHEAKDCKPLFTFAGIDEGYKKEIASHGLNDFIRDVGTMPHEESLRYSRTSDALMVIVNNDNPLRSGTIPAKTYEAMALQRHILAVVPPNSDVRALLEEYGNATLCNVDDPDEICAGILELVTRRTTGQLYGESGKVKRPGISEKYSRRAQVRQLATLIEHLAEEP